ncbi:MAG: hypothetical protein HGB37_05370 [Candidatus Moranbacteria bacterium]|nr:hypothetical protein [Candidatus Moranbacteria bacterium]
MFCSKCGEKIGEANTSCSKCGADVSYREGFSESLVKANNHKGLEKALLFIFLLWAVFGIVVILANPISAPISVYIIIFLPVIVIFATIQLRKYMRGEMKTEVRNVWIVSLFIVLLIGIFLLFNRSEFDSCYKKCLDNGISGRYCIATCGKH